MGLKLNSLVGVILLSQLSPLHSAYARSNDSPNFHRFDGTYTLQSQSYKMNCHRVLHIAADDRTQVINPVDVNGSRQINVTQDDDKFSNFAFADVSDRYPENSIDHFFSQINFFEDEYLINNSSTSKKITNHSKIHGEDTYRSIEKLDDSSIALVFGDGTCKYRKTASVVSSSDLRATNSSVKSLSENSAPSSASAESAASAAAAR